ncbi:MAG: hypothetical protein A2491_21750 [Bacteroidetes bacterium RIFOXYC12_FULL_35_7]|nr:MAG: hypothetical protein A2491_21750 [Bacteroidetes bacterium RIFOXYC12_FULL_35_7]
MATKTIVIDGPIGQYSFSKQFMRNELSGQSKNPILIKISSLGGSVDDALNIYDQFIEHGSVTAELSAFVASSATLISLGAKTVRMNENSFYLIHKAMNWVDEWGSTSTILAATWRKSQAKYIGRYLQTPSGEEGRDRQAGWRSEIVGYPTGNRPDDPTGDIPGDTDI